MQDDKASEFQRSMLHWSWLGKSLAQKMSGNCLADNDRGLMDVSLSIVCMRARVCLWLSVGSIEVWWEQNCR